MLKKLTDLIDSLKTVTDNYPNAEFELGFCSCCIYIIIDGKKVGILNLEEDEFEYLQPLPPPDPVLAEAIKKHFGIE